MPASCKTDVGITSTRSTDLSLTRVFLRFLLKDPLPQELHEFDRLFIEVAVLRHIVFPKQGPQTALRRSLGEIIARIPAAGCIPQPPGNGGDQPLGRWWTGQRTDTHLHRQVMQRLR